MMPDEVVKSEEQHAAEAAVAGFRRALGPFVVAAEATRMPMIFTDAAATGHPIIFVNQAFLNLTGYEEHEVLGQRFDFLMERGTDLEMLAEIQTAFEGGRDLEPLVHYRCKDGGAVWVTIFITPVRDEHGGVVQHFASFVDVTRHKDEEDRLRSLLERLNERTQATLSTVLAITDATSGGLSDDDLNALKGSIVAVSKAQGVLERTGGRVRLSDLIDQMFKPVGIDDRLSSRVAAQADQLGVRPRTAIVLAVLLQELANNAMKHGALSNDGGTVAISWRVEAFEDAERLRLRWQERGGPAVMPSRPGYASRLIERGLAQELGGDVRFDYQAAGVICEITMPWDGAPADRPSSD